MYHDIKYSGCNLAHSSDMTSNVLNRTDLKFHISQQHPEWKSTGGSIISRYYKHKYAYTILNIYTTYHNCHQGWENHTLCSYW